jgi:hypothetical protein
VGSIPTWGILICLALGNALQILSPVFTGALTGLAQLVEHVAFILKEAWHHRVAGSTPAIGIFCIFFRYIIT